MSRSITWIVAILGGALIWSAAIYDRLPAIERDLRARAEFELQRRGLDRRFDGLAVTVEGRDLRVTGAALSELDRRTALAVVSRISGVRRVIDATVLAPRSRPFVFRVGRDAAGRTALSGAMPDADHRERLLARLRGANANEISDTTVIRLGVPAGNWLAAATLAGEIALMLAEGEAVLTDRALHVAGRVADDAALDAIEERLRRHMPAGFTGSATLDTPLDELVRNGAAVRSIADAKSCTLLFADIVKARPLEFEARAPILTPRNRRSLARLVGAAARCAGFCFEIRAHVARGAGDDAAADLRLAESRASALVHYLAGAGVARSCLSARGFVDPAPAADERIEIVARAGASRGRDGGEPPPAGTRVALASAARVAP